MVDLFRICSSVHEYVLPKIIYKHMFREGH
jgi:hypothetical protein